MLKDVCLKPVTGTATKRLVIVLHGLGDCASGIISLAEAFRPALPETEFVAPDAPFPCDFSPFGFQWFSAGEWQAQTVLDGVKKAAAPLNAYIDEVMERHALTPDKVALMGFSQGTMMSLYVAPRRANALAGVLGYSGALVGGDELAAGERHSSPPIMLVHGTEDDIVPFSFMNKAVEALRNVNMNVTPVPCPGLGHSVDDLGLANGIRFLRQIFSL